jgi:DNA-binding NtrC family response regulator
MAEGKILIVDDNINALTALELMLQEEFEQIKTLDNPVRIPDLMERNMFDVVLLDMNFTPGQKSGNEGLYWLEKILEIYPLMSVVMLTAYGEVDLAVNALKRGATDFILKPWENEKLMATVKSAAKLHQSRKEVGQLRNREQILRNELRPEPCLIVGHSPKLVEVLKVIQKVAITDANVLLTGENGTGKELFARELHRLSNRSNDLLLTVDMGAVSESLFESELFGHVKGAFTDARDDRQGKFEAAHKGTLFLDEIGNLTLPLQAKLLAVLQNRTVVRVGSNKPISIDIRLVCATNRNLEQMVANGQFREDLLFRINTIHIDIPPLRERVEDIATLAEFYLDKYACHYGKSKQTLNKAALEKLENYRWPGNVRELQHTMEKAIIMSDGKLLTPDDFILKTTVNSTIFFPDTIDEMEKLMLEKALEKHKGNLSAAAEQLGIARQTLYNKMKKYNLS